MDYESIKVKYEYKISSYVNKISSSMNVSASTTGAKLITTSGYVTPGETTEQTINECVIDFTETLAIDYPDAAPQTIEEMVAQIFDKEVIPRVKKTNEQNMNTEMTKSYWSNVLEEIIAFIIISAILVLILKIIGVIH